MFSHKAYETVIRVLENHISRQNRIIAELLSKVMKEDVSFEAPKMKSNVDTTELEEEGFQERFVPMFRDYEPNPGDILNSNKDS